MSLILKQRPFAAPPIERVWWQDWKANELGSCKFRTLYNGRFDFCRRFAAIKTNLAPANEKGEQILLEGVSIQIDVNGFVADFSFKNLILLVISDLLFGQGLCQESSDTPRTTLKRTRSRSEETSGTEECGTNISRSIPLEKSNDGTVNLPLNARRRSKVRKNFHAELETAVNEKTIEELRDSFCVLHESEVNHDKRYVSERILFSAFVCGSQGLVT